MLPPRLLPVILLLAAAPLGGCSSTSNQPRDAAAAPHDATTPHDGTTHLDARDAGSSDGAQAASGIACGDASCVVGQQFCYTLMDRRTDAGTTSNVCTMIPANCAHVEAGTACSCVFAATQCQDPNSRVCSMKAGMVLQTSCQLK
jgi:hypothetical protein